MHSNWHEFEFSVLVNGKPITEYAHNNATFVEGRKGSDYELLCKNRTSGRVLFVPSVDGLSVFDGKPCSMESSGYIVDPRSEIRIPGWTLDSGNVAKFTFSAQDQAYTAQIGEGVSNTGVIAVRVFKEKVIPHRFNTYYKGGPFGSGSVGSGALRSSSATLSSSTLSQNSIFNSVSNPVEQFAYPYPDSSVTKGLAVEKLGTAFGESTDFATVKSRFEKANTLKADAELALFYDTRKGLERRGINLNPEPVMPNPFPGDSGCKPPPGWTGR